MHGPLSSPLDLLVWGATGFTGRLTAEYLARARARTPFTWGLGGRSEAKLRGVRDHLATIDPALAELPLVVGDAMDAAAMDRVAHAARVVATTAGPFAHHGNELIAACARAGTHYCDLTGEVTFVRRAIDRHHETASRSKARLVPCSGFDSIPSDLGVWLLHQTLQARGTRLTRARFYLIKSSGGLSGGTLASMILLVEEASQDKDVRRLLADPLALDPGARERGVSAARDTHGASHDPDLDAWVAPFVMAAINTRVVRRSNALLDYAYGRDFDYGEVVRCGKGARGAVAAAAVAGGLGAAMGVMAVPPLRTLLARTVFPAPGEGPSKEKRDAGHFTIRLLGEGADGQRAWVTVRGTSDPGYGETAKMLGESALALALDQARLPERYGVLTPATALGDVLVERLRAAGMDLSVE